MNAAVFKRNVRPTDAKVFLQIAVLGLAFSELSYVAISFSKPVNQLVSATDSQITALAACLITTLIGGIYLYSRDAQKDLRRIIESRRFDLAAPLIIGGMLSVCVGGIGTSSYQTSVTHVSVSQILFLISAPICAAFLLVIKALLLQSRKEAPSFFLDDRAVESQADDLLDLNGRAKIFAERVLNGGSSQSLVFGIDAPWGIGKSSFINFCCEYWAKERSSQVIVHKFEPLRYAEKADLVSVFVDDLIGTIQKHAFAPEISSIVEKYSRLMKGKSDFSFLGIKFELSPGNSSIDDTLESLQVLLAGSGKKIIIVVDDLDRLSWSNTKSILNAIQTSFRLPNIAYVLCYDTENIVLSREKPTDAQSVIEFLEKFVNVKTSLFLDPSSLAAYVSENFALAVQKNLQANSRRLDEIKLAINELVNICNSNEFHNYQRFIGDIRKLKRLINTLVLLEIEQTDLANSDFNKRDLIDLLLIFINYPHIFRKIYNAESNGRTGVFSAVRGEGKYTNSSQYQEYVKGLSAPESFLISKVFDVAQRSNNDDFSDVELKTLACFNNQYGDRNLERYLNLLIKLSKPEKRTSYTFYLNCRNDFLNGTSIENIFEREEFSFLRGDSARTEFLNVIANSRNALNGKLGPALFLHLLNTIPDYSAIEHSTLEGGSRHKLMYTLLKLADEVAWQSDEKSRRNNSAKNIAEIGEWIFGEGRHADSGVIDTLSDATRGALGFYDVLIFRLYCSADRGGSFFNLQSSLSHRAGPDAPTSGLTTEIAKEGMREISQRIFKIFKTQYIETGKNIFRVAHEVSLQEFAGKSALYVIGKFKEMKVPQVEIDKLLLMERQRVSSFIVYQLGNSRISSGVGCGFYDEDGNNDQKGIASEMNRYLFDHCFSLDIDPQNVEIFLDYLLTHFVRVWGFDDEKHVPQLEEGLKVLDRGHLKEYWKNNRDTIHSMRLTEKDKSVSTSNYVTTYMGDLPAVYQMLDGLLIEPLVVEASAQTDSTAQ